MLLLLFFTIAPPILVALLGKTKLWWIGGALPLGLALVFAADVIARGLPIKADSRAMLVIAAAFALYGLVLLGMGSYRLHRARKAA